MLSSSDLSEIVALLLWAPAPIFDPVALELRPLKKLVDDFGDFNCLLWARGVLLLLLRSLFGCGELVSRVGKLSLLIE